jgi:hypothetical protein
MKTTIVPAQITTVEDRIAGSLTFPQIVLMIIPLLTSTAIYVCIPTQMHFGITKIILICLQFLFFGILAIRIQGKILAEWLVIYLRFSFRPRRYIFTKNDIFARSIDLKTVETAKSINKAKKKKKIISRVLSLPDRAKMNSLLKNPAMSVSFKLAKKGGLYISLKSVK